MEKDEIVGVAFEIILDAGNARTLVHEALDATHEGDYDLADQKLEEADGELIKAHNAQTNLLTAYAGGEDINVELVLAHAEDHLMTTLTLQEMAIELLRMSRKFSQEEEK